MIVPSIEITRGRVAQSTGESREEQACTQDPVVLAEKAGRVGEVTVVDLDASTGSGCNAEKIRRLLPVARCRVESGVRDVQSAIDWLDAGATRVILAGARPDVLACLPVDRVIVKLDAEQDSAKVIEQLVELKDYAGEYLIVFGREGQGIDMELAGQCVQAVGNSRITVAGKVIVAEEIARLDAMGVNAQIGSTILRNSFSLAEGFCSPLTSDRPDQLWPTIVSNEAGQALGLTYSNLESVDCSLETGVAHYWSRKRGLWKKGETSGATQDLLAIDMDCDRDTLRFTVRQNGSGFCHLPQSTCFGNLAGIERLQRQLYERLQSAPEGSYTQKLFQSPEMLNSKLLEEADELATAVSPAEIVHEAADVTFFTLTRLVKEGIPWSEVERELDKRSLKVTRRTAMAETGDSRVNV